MEPGLLKYEVRVLLALKESIAGKEAFFRWLATAGYPELAAFSNMLQDDVEAEHWLVRNGFHWLGLVSHAIDGDDKSRRWVKSKLHESNLMFCLACRRDDKAVSWLRFMHLDVLDLLAEEVASLRDKQELDQAFPYKMRF